MAVTMKEARQKYFYCINSRSCGRQTKHVRPPRRSTKKESRKSSTAWLVTKYCTPHKKLGHCKRSEKVGRCARHLNENNTQQKTAGKASRSSSHHEKKNKHYLTLRKKEKYMCVILDTCNNNTRIRGARLIAINSFQTATGRLKIIFKISRCCT